MDSPASDDSLPLFTTLGTLFLVVSLVVMSWQPAVHYALLGLSLGAYLLSVLRYARADAPSRADRRAPRLKRQPSERVTDA